MNTAKIRSISIMQFEDLVIEDLVTACQQDNQITRSQSPDDYWFDNNSFTIVLMVLPSARPASCLLAIPITLPISAGDVAPVSAIIFFTIVFSSVSSSCFGRNFSITAISSFSLAARS